VTNSAGIELTNMSRQELAHPQESLPAHLRLEVVRKTPARAQRPGGGEGAGEGNERREGGRATGNSHLQYIYISLSLRKRLLIKQTRIQAIKDRRAAKEEKERYEKMAEKMHRKRVERKRRREKRNKLLNS
jgi:Cgr1 family